LPFVALLLAQVTSCDVVVKVTYLTNKNVLP